MAYEGLENNKNVNIEVVDVYSLLLDHEWFYIPKFIDKDFKTGNKDLDKLVWREFYLHPPKEVLN